MDHRFKVKHKKIKLLRIKQKKIYGTEDQAEF